MLQDCKYRLPCNWCDKYDRMCEAVLLEIYKQQEEKSIGKPKPEECDHHWTFGGTTENTGGTYNHYYCRKCGAMMMRDSNGISYVTGEWKP